MEFLFLKTWTLILENGSRSYVEGSMTHFYRGIRELQHLIVRYKWEILYLLFKALQRIQLNRIEVIKAKRQWQNILKFQYSFKMHITEQKASHLKLFWPNSIILI